VEEKSELVGLDIVGEEKDALLSALRMCRGDYSWAFKGWKKESCQIWLSRLEEDVENVQLEYICPWRPMQENEVRMGKLVFVKNLKPFLVDVLIFYIGGFPDEYGGAELWKKEVCSLIRRMALF